MAGFTRRSDYVNSEESQAVKGQLQLMAADKTYNTVSSYTPNTDRYPDNRISFVEKHMNYLNSHPQLDALKYVANLRLMTRIH